MYQKALGFKEVWNKSHILREGEVCGTFQGCLRANDFSGGVDDYCDLGEVLVGGGVIVVAINLNMRWVLVL